MVFGRIQHGQIELAAALPEAWEGQLVRIEPCTPDDALPDLEQRLAELLALGPMEFEPGEREEMERYWRELDELGRQEMQHLMDRPA